MGQRLQRLVNKNEKNSLTRFDQLPTETILDIFEYLSSNDIIYTFFYFNQRFNSILLQHQRYLSNFETPTTNIKFWKNIFPVIGSYIQQLSITTIDFSFSLNLFSNLKSIIICSPLPIDHNQLYYIFQTKELNKLNSFKIQSKIINQRDHDISGGLLELLFGNLFNKTYLLETFECLSILKANDFRIFNKSIIYKNIHSLSLKSTHFRDAFSLLKHTPNLKSFNLIFTSFFVRQEVYEELDLSEIKLKKFYLTFEPNQTDDIQHWLSEEDFRLLINSIKQFSSSLILLSLNFNKIIISPASTFQFNGIHLQQQFLESMTQLQQFHFYTKINKYSTNLKNLLSTFENPFWFDHHWSIGMHGNHLYTLPFRYDQFNDFIDFDHIQSNNPQILNSSQTWHRITSIVLHLSEKLDFNLIKQIKIKMPNLISIVLTSSSNSTEDFYINEDQINESNITLDSVITVHLKDYSMKHIKQWLSNILSTSKYLVLYDTFSFIPIVAERIEKLKILHVHCGSKLINKGYFYFPNLQVVEIELYFLEFKDHLNHHIALRVMEILESFKHSKTLIIWFYWGKEYNVSKNSIENLNKTIANLDKDTILKNYRLKQSYNYLQFIKIDKQ